jgi:hypothetical protein
MEYGRPVAVIDPIQLVAIKRISKYKGLKMFFQSIKVDNVVPLVSFRSRYEPSDGIGQICQGNRDPQKTRENTTFGLVSLCGRSQHVVTSSAGLRSHHHT